MNYKKFVARYSKHDAPDGLETSIQRFLRANPNITILHGLQSTHFDSCFNEDVITLSIFYEDKKRDTKTA